MGRSMGLILFQRGIHRFIWRMRGNLSRVDFSSGEIMSTRFMG